MHFRGAKGNIGEGGTFAERKATLGVAGGGLIR
jgi:hypothetical protein